MEPVVIDAVPLPARPVPVPTTGTGRVVISRPAILTGWSFTETTGTDAATLDLYTGRDTTGVLALTVALTAGASDTGTTGRGGLYLDAGAFLDVTAGSVRGALWLAYHEG